MAERVNPFLAMANKNNEKNSKDLKENPESPIKYGDEAVEEKKDNNESVKEEKKEQKTEVKPEEKKATSTKSAETPIVNTQKKIAKTNDVKTPSSQKRDGKNAEKTQIKLVEADINYKVDLKSPNIKRKGVDLLKDNDAFLSARSRELGMKIQDYFSLLVLEDMARIDNGKVEILDELVLESTTTGKETSRRTVVMEEKTFIGIKRNSAKCAMKETQYLNYLIAAERNREEQNGARKGLYD